MNTKHTPGPWTLNDPAVFNIDGFNVRLRPIVTGGFVVSYVNAGNLLPHAEANAAAIAAAPELLAALENLVQLHHDWDAGRASITVAFKQRNDAAIATARAAIAAARGEG